jgi:hypothetical protein
LGNREIPDSCIENSGYIFPEDMEGLKCNNNGHTIRVSYIDDGWHFYYSFFGGRIGFFIRISGPNNEDWQTTNILAPLKSKIWTITPSPIIQPINDRFNFGWSDLTKIIPSVELINVSSKIHINDK